MDRQKELRLGERRHNSFREEERLGLLHEEGDENCSEISGVEEADWGRREKSTHQQLQRSNWLRRSVIALFAIGTLGFIAHSFFTPHQNQSSNTAPAQLRPEEDYILNPEWEFNAATTTREYDWTIAEHELNPDGVYRPMTLINGMFPGPLIECNEGDEIVIHVHNKASNATSIHWHGLYQNGTNWMDGTVGITQCPIAPGHSFTYRFNVSGQTGTYWYHSHMAMQASDGLVGPIVIHAKGDEEKQLQKVPYGEDRVVLVSDHYYDLSNALLVQYLSPGNENDEPVPQSALINGRGTRNCADLPNRNCSSADRSNTLFDFSPQYNTRLRIINVGVYAEFQIQIDEHEFQLTEVDGVDVHPQSIHRLNINPAQRYSIVVTPPNPNKGLYWMRARMITHCFAYEEPELQEEVRGVVKYWAHGESVDPESKDWPDIIEVECRDLNTSALEPVKAIAAPKEADDQVYLRSSFQIRDWRLSRGYLNDSSYRANISHPTLNTLIAGYSKKQEGYVLSLAEPFGVNTEVFNPKRTLVYQTTGIRTIDILIQNLDDGNHPFHLHGHTFFVLASGHGYPPADLYSKLNLTNPLRRDTASVEAFGWTLIRFMADNPGAWAFHCHLGWHNEAGLLMQFLTRADEVAKWTLPAEVEGLCAVKGIEKGAGPDDEMWVGSWD
ncbi:multicopper oxidase [Lentithecium fluviatile CBS 122367]|uniref:Multicopper oxidase n=1 Tax=Lentithecium fluviatile CBS 122367 TaxID=1168545 RepID=A0A6G1IDJ3_9PLEO|nr:multicopper oxidase [Lentithecium fluviatile CBS 122367]